MANHENSISVSERQLYILSLLSQNSIGYTADEIVSRLEQWEVNLTKRTIQRDIDELSMSYAIEEEERDGKIYYMARKFNMENVELTIIDLMGIKFMQELVSPYENTMLGSAADNILKKISEHTGNLNKKHMEMLNSTIQIQDRNSWKNQDINPEYERMISNAIDKHLKVQIEYYSWNSNQVSTRIIHPYAFIVLDQYLSVKGYCELRNEIRTFRLSRIRNIQILDEHFVIPADSEYKTDSKFIYIGGDKEEQLILLFDMNAGRFVQEYQSHRADQLTVREDGIVFEKKTAITDEVRRWIQQFGAGVRVLEPEWLAKELCEEADKMKRLYESGEKP